MRQASKGDMSSRVPPEKAVFCRAAEITDLEQRRQFLDETCGTDKVLRDSRPIVSEMCQALRFALKGE